MGLTDDPTDECIKVIRPDGMQECYLVLPQSERDKGFVRPVRQDYIHLACGASTHMALALAETYARDPSFYGGTFCAHCRKHFNLRDHSDPAGPRFNFAWDPPDGSFVGE